MIGINDLARGIAPDSVLHNIGTFVRLLREYSPTTQIFIQSLLPVNPDLKMFAQHTSKAAEIKYVNGILEREAGQGYAYIDLHTHFLGEDGKLSRRWTNDGLHLNGDGYMLWKHIVFPLVYDLQARPAIIPQPLDISWLEGSFPLYKLKNITIPRSGLDNEAVILKGFLGSLGLYPRIIQTGSPEAPVIVLNLDPAYDGPSQEAYSIMVSPQRVEIRAKGAHGILHGIQTLKQLCRDGVMVPCCIIKDAPAFQWRGFMIDVGRNYVSPDILNQIIDKMSFYKFNIFHFHPTEDIAWRLESRLYPQLTAPEYMLRDKGLYYTVAELKSLIEFCRTRHITFVPEIDMPGHSAAFRRAMGVDMQSDSGTVLVKKIIGELMDDYPLQYVHVGGDEVKIENKDFLPDIVAMIQGRGLRTIAWSPGGETNSRTMRQLWMDDDGHNNKAGELMYIDSRHLYLNHMDPLEAVTTIYYRKIGERTRGDTAFPGATLCLWNDRAVADGSDILSMNPVYPGMMAFAERVWNGGVGPDGLQAFRSMMYRYSASLNQDCWTIKHCISTIFPFHMSGNRISAGPSLVPMPMVVTSRSGLNRKFQVSRVPDGRFLLLGALLFSAIGGRPRSAERFRIRKKTRPGMRQQPYKAMWTRCADFGLVSMTYRDLRLRIARHSEDGIIDKVSFGSMVTKCHRLFGVIPASKAIRKFRSWMKVTVTGHRQ